MSQEYLIKSESLTAIADEVRTLSGTTELMGLDAVATNVGEANTEIDNQVELLAQAVAALEGKVSGSGGGAAVETCTVTVNEMTPAQPERTVSYVDETGTYRCTGTIGYGETVTFKVYKHSLIIFMHLNSNNVITLDNGSANSCETVYNGYGEIWQIDSDCEITLSF